MDKDVVHVCSGIVVRKRNEIGSLVVMQMDLESVIHNEANQKNKYLVLTIYMESRKMVQGSTICRVVTEISPGISLEGMMLKLKLQYLGHLM